MVQTTIDGPWAVKVQRLAPELVVAVGPEAAAAATTAGPVTAEAAGPRTGAARRRLVDADRAAVEIEAVQPAERLVRFFGRRHLDEAEAARASRFAVRHDGGGHHDAEARESRAQ